VRVGLQQASDGDAVATDEQALKEREGTVV
jgi:hypothetical protein